MRGRKLRGGSSNFPFHLVFFPTAFTLSSEGLGMVVMVACVSAIETGVINLLAHPSLASDD
jgi:hypothetical protein